MQNRFASQKTCCGFMWSPWCRAL